MRAASRFAIGTAQFGLSYGIANLSGQVARDVASAILDEAKEAGIDTIDTAVAYGSSEQRLGEIGVRGWRVVSKLGSVPPECRDVRAWVSESVHGSLQRLRLPKLHGLLLHQPIQLLADRGAELYDALAHAKQSGLCDKIGVSIYAPDELDALASRYRFDLVQAPLNIIDRRLISSGWLAQLHDAGIEVHTRSAFLQGLLLMETERRPEYFSKWDFLWQRWDAWLSNEGMTRLQGALSYVMSVGGIDRIVVGIDNVEQLREILAVATRKFVGDVPDLASQDLALINPSSWNKV